MAQRTVLLLTLLSSAGLFSYACGGEKDGDASKPDGDNEGGQANTDGSGGSATKPGKDTNTTCQSDKACTAQDQICDPDRGVCVDCLSDDDCPKNAACRTGSCVGFTPCKSSKDCTVDQVCNAEIERCVECVTSRDCDSGALCVNDSCVPSCSSDKDCRSLDQICNPDAGHCVECLGTNDCGKGQHCTAQNICEKNVCEPESTVCDGDLLFTCNETGTGFNSTSCARGCGEVDGVAQCKLPPPGSCDRAATVSPCDGLPRFTGTQIVDGKDDDFCDVPYYEITPQDAGFVATASGAVTTPTSSMVSKTRMRVAWSPGFLHAHMHVTDPLINSGTSYDGDNVQFFLSSAVPTNSAITATCASGSIKSADRTKGLQQLFFLPPEATAQGGGAARLIARCNNYDATEMDWTVRAVEDGYELEFKYPWVAAYSPQVAQAEIGFDVLIGVNDRANLEGAQYQYGLFMAAGTSSSCTAQNASSKGLWCDASLWCRPQLAN